MSPTAVPRRIERSPRACVFALPGAREAIARALADGSAPHGLPAAQLLERGTLKLYLYGPRGRDPQPVHEQDEGILDDVFARADELSEDPLHSFLIALKMLAKIFADLPGGHPGCMVASVCYHEQLFDREIRELNAQAVLGWRQRFRERLERIAERASPRLEVGLDDLADMFSGITDGGIILSRVTEDPQALPRQLLLYRDFIRLVFSEPSAPGLRP